ncbi:MAG: hypothetical protein ACHQ5A_11695, partial [Opitutales bacterium]
TPPAPDLQVTVDVPPTWRPFLQDDIAEAFASRIQTVFKQRGYTGRIAYLDRATDPRPGVPVLEVRLVEWRIGRTQDAQCTFSASLRTDGGEKSLGLVANTAFFWPEAGGRWGLARRMDVADALEDAAARALRELFQRVAETGAVPGLVAKK